MGEIKPKTVYHKIHILMDNKKFKLWIDCNDDMVKSLVQKHNPSSNLELKELINNELKREAALLA